MGDIAEMMLDGTLCQVCGVYLGEDCGHPVSCPSCQGPRKSRAEREGGGWECPQCDRNFKTKGAKKQHMRDIHKSKFDDSGRVVPIHQDPEPPKAEA